MSIKKTKAIVYKVNSGKPGWADITIEEWEKAFANLRSGEDVKAFIHPNGTDW